MASRPAGEAFVGGALGSVKRLLRLNFKERDVRKKLIELMDDRKAENEALIEKSAGAQLLEIQLAKDLDELREDGPEWDAQLSTLAARKVAALKTSLESVRHAREDLYNSVSAAEEKASDRELEVEAITKSLTHKTAEMEELAARAKDPANDGTVNEARSFAKAIIEELARVEAEAAAAAARAEGRAMFVQLLSVLAGVFLAFSTYSFATPARSIAAVPPQATVSEECVIGEADCVEVEVCEAGAPGCVEIDVGA